MRYRINLISEFLQEGARAASQCRSRCQCPCDSRCFKVLSCCDPHSDIVVPLINLSLTVSMDAWFHLSLQNARGHDREVGGSPGYARGGRHGRATAWRYNSPEQYYSRSSHHYVSKSDRRSRSWSPSTQRQQHEKEIHRNVTETIKWIPSPPGNYRGVYHIHIHTRGISQMHGQII